MMRTRLLAIFAALACVAAASDPAERLPDPTQEAQAREIFHQVRCLVCQNESIDDSEAPLAQDLRMIVREQVAAGRSEDQILTYLTDRYGEFVLLKPAFSWGNAALWAAPLLALFAGSVLWWRRLGRRKGEPELSASEAKAVARLTKDETR